MMLHETPEMHSPDESDAVLEDRFRSSFEARLGVQRDLMKRAGVREGQEGPETLEWADRYSRAYRHLCRTRPTFLDLVVQTNACDEPGSKALMLVQIQEQLDQVIQEDPTLLEDEFTKGSGSSESPEAPAHPA